MRAPHEKTLCRPFTAARAQIHARAARRPHLNIERGFEDLLEQLALVHGGGRSDAQASSVLQQHNLIRKFRGEREFVRYEHDGVAIFLRQLPQTLQ